MSWFDSVVSGVGSLFSGDNSIGGTLVSTVVTGYALNKVSKSLEKAQSEVKSGASSPSVTTTTDAAGNKRTVVATDFGQLLTFPANQDNKVPVLYGTAYVPGVVTDAVMSATRQEMTYVVTICETTGQTNLGQGTQSHITFDEVLWNNNRIVFKADGITAESTVDNGGNVDTNVDGLIKVYCYNNGSHYSTSPAGYTAAQSVAYDIVPNWTPFYTMDGLVFVVVKVTYNKTKGVTGIPNMSFKLTNTMNKPGDCIYDYMTNTRYGAGIPAEDIYV
jgi:hypothetical protein